MAVHPYHPYSVAFDVMETLIDLEPLAERFADIGQPPDLLRPWFLRAQRDCMALALSGELRPFPEVARQALRTASGNTASEDGITYVLQGFGRLPAHPDAEPAMRRLHEAGVRMGCLTQGSRAATTAFLKSSGLDRFVDAVVTAEEAGVWKPAPGVYRAAAAALETPPEHLALIAVHAWDCHGAKRAGCLAGWCSRLEVRYGDVFAAPDARGDTLTDVATGLLELTAAG
ncbi:haloacid dehalogenase type II [Streptomonospora wellingtoniae]|uniref:Haloacid dehalogenase type II n=1 Tax=Streptomonospora wellingtoniae TaxID=3075544 RepID=A0ABU2L1B5_9ACTN|nr:haloacid dehalogenase type II [Streptomonospora sp. DSM 45055]MDT0305292.1 haloacid dehalogenase type II [Streptomonospora sp. DSM 45055]